MIAGVAAALGVLCALLGIRLGGLRKQLGDAEADRDVALKGLATERAQSRDRVRRLEAVIADRDAALRSLRAQLEASPDPVVRGRAAVAGIRELLSRPHGGSDTHSEPTADAEPATGRAEPD